MSRIHIVFFANPDHLGLDPPETEAGPGFFNQGQIPLLGEGRNIYINENIFHPPPT